MSNAAAHWMQLQILGRNAKVLDDKVPVFFPRTNWALDQTDTRSLASITPFTIDEAILGRIVAFGKAFRRLWVDDEPLDERTAFRAALTTVTSVPRALQPVRRDESLHARVASMLPTALSVRARRAKGSSGVLIGTNPRLA